MNYTMSVEQIKVAIRDRLAHTFAVSLENATDEEYYKASALIVRELLAKGKKKGKLDSSELMDAVDDLNLESEQMDQLYDSLEALNIDISADEDLLPDLPEDEQKFLTMHIGVVLAQS